MNIKATACIPIMALAIAFPQGAWANPAAASSPTPSAGPNGDTHFSSQSSDLVNQNQHSVTNNDTNQASTGVVQQSATYNVGQASTYDFRGISGTKVYCPKPSVLLSGGAAFGSYGSNSQQVSAALVLPLGGRLNRNCNQISDQIVKEQEQYLLHQAFNHQYEMASRCASLKKTGASISPEVFPDLAAMCDGVKMAPPVGGATTPPPPVKVPPPPPSIRSSY